MRPPDYTECFVVVQFRFEHIHSWPQCDIDEVSFLRDPHRHVFQTRAWLSVSHEDREVEIIRLKRQMSSWVEKVGKPRWDTASCETMAREMLVRFALEKCEVLEDGENGALVRRMA